jgi:TatD DNase family protein
MFIFVLQINTMFVDIHTHTKSESKYPAIRNLTFPEAETFFSSSAKETVSVGIHPWDVDDFSEKSFKKLELWIADNRLIAIGECGLDKNGKAPTEEQLIVLKKHILLSERIRKPLIIHCVGCFDKLMELKKTIKPQQLWIIHGFRGKPEQAVQLLKSGCALSFGEHFNVESVCATPIEKLFIETDESSLTIEVIYARIAIAKNCSPKLLSAGEDLYKQIQAYK